MYLFGVHKNSETCEFKGVQADQPVFINVR